MKKISVIIPFLNESENIPVLVQSLNDYFSKAKDYSCEVIFVNDGSTDNSLALLKDQKHVAYSCKIISLSRNFGSHAALRAGIQRASGDLVTFMYADLQDPLELIDKMFAVSQSGCDIVWATRNSTNNGLFETMFSKFYSSMMKRYVTPLYPSKGFDIVMFNRKVAETLNNHMEANSSIFLQILTMGFRQDFIFYEKQPRKKGKSKWTLSKKIKLFIDSFIAFSFAPIRFVTAIGILLFIIGSLFTLYLIARKILFNDLASGWPMLISIITMGFGITNISLGIIAEYLWRTLDSARNRPVFIIDQYFEYNHEQ